MWWNVGRIAAIALFLNQLFDLEETHAAADMSTNHCARDRLETLLLFDQSPLSLFQSAYLDLNFIMQIAKFPVQIADACKPQECRKAVHFFGNLYLIYDHQIWVHSPIMMSCAVSGRRKLPQAEHT